MLAGGDNTDVITMKNVTDYSRYASRGQLAGHHRRVDQARQAPSWPAWTRSTSRTASTYALPYRQDFWLLYYNKDLFEAAGIKYPDDLTWDEYAEVAKKLTHGRGRQEGLRHLPPHLALGGAGDRGRADRRRPARRRLQLLRPTSTTMALGLQKSGRDHGLRHRQRRQQTSYRTMFETGRPR